MKDSITKILLKVLNILFLYNIVGTSYGCILGIFLQSISGVFAAYFPVVGLIKWYGYIAFGVLIFNFKPIVRKEYEDPNIEKKLKYTKEMIENGNFSEKEKRVIWKNFIDSVLKEPENNNKFDDNAIE